MSCLSNSVAVFCIAIHDSQPSSPEKCTKLKLEIISNISQCSALILLEILALLKLSVCCG